MYIIQNALKNLVRNKGRNIMIGSIIFAIILTTVISLIINNTATTVIEDYKDRFGSEVSITPNMQKVQEEAMKNSVDGKMRITRPEISSELLIQFADSEYLKESIATGSTMGNSTQIKAIDQTDDDGAGTTSGQKVMIAGGNGNYSLLGDSWSDFSDGLRSIESGRLPEEDSECVISMDLQEQNNISVGDTLLFTAKMRIPTPDDIENVEDGDLIEVNGTEYTISISGLGTVNLHREVEYSLTVVGIYNDLTDEYPNPNMPKMAAMNRRNEILTTLNTLLAQRGVDESGVSVNVTYFLKDPSMLSAFETEVRAKGLSDLFEIGTDAASYDSIVKPVLGLKSISITFMIVVMVLGGVILLLLTSISIRERKYEIGVLRAMGMKKGKVALGIWAEIFAITCICLVIGLGIGMVVAQPVSDVLLNSQVTAAESTQQGPNGMVTSGGHAAGAVMMGSGGAMKGASSNAKPLSEMKITLDMITVLEIIAISILLASLAGLVSISKITKYEPIKILMERN
jgi:putative ABC transport system permease protein